MPLLWLSLAILAGIILANIIPLPLTTWLFLVGVCLIWMLARFTLKRWVQRPTGKSYLNSLTPIFTLPFPLPILLIAVFAGASRYQSSVTGLVLVSAAPGKEFHYGDRVVIRGYLETPREDEAFSYRDYLARQGIYTYIRGTKVSTLETGQGHWLMTRIYSLKGEALVMIYQLWPDPEASLFAGILLGVETNIPEPVQQAFKSTGTSHIIAISGFNIAIISALFTRSFGRMLGPYKGGLAALVAITIYTVLVGADAAVVRAAIMGGLSLFAGLVGRRQSGVYTLVITAGAMSIINPQILWDLGFQLSFAAALGLILYAEPLTQVFIRLASRWVSDASAEKIAGPVGEFILFTFAEVGRTNRKP